MFPAIILILSIWLFSDIRAEKKSKKEREIPTQITLLLLVFLIMSCESTATEKTNSQDASIPPTAKATEKTDTPKSNRFERFLSNFKMTKLPIEIYDPCNIESKDLEVLSASDYKTCLADEEEVSYVQIPANGNYVAVVTFGLGDCFLPLLTTYTPDGKKIDHHRISPG